MNKTESKQMKEEGEMTDKRKEIMEELNRAAEAYYNSDSEAMSDKEYDEMYDELVKQEMVYGVLDGSPTQTPGIAAPKASKLAKVRHEVPALSLDKTKDAKALKAWLGDKQGILSWKMDGLTVVASYNHGMLAQAVTRGNGLIGEDVTHNTQNFRGLPRVIPYSGNLMIRGEAVISYEEFERINSMLPAGAEPYKNPRNLASGTVRLVEGIGDRKVDFYAFKMVRKEDGKPQLESEQFRFLKNVGIRTVEHKIVSSGTLEESIREMESRIPENGFPSDGLVLSYNDSEYADGLGTTGKFPKGSMAFKWKDETADTTIREIEWSVGASGAITPVAVFDAVELEGTTVTRASMHNISIMEGLGAGIGATVSVYKANMIIPQIAGVKAGASIPTHPDRCPACGEPTSVHRSFKSGKEVRTLFCDSGECPAKHVGMFERFVCRDAMNIVGLSTETIQKFIDKGFLKNVADIFRLDAHKDEIVSMDGFGEKSFDNLMTAIEASKNISEPWRLIYALNIPNVGHDASKRIMKWCGNDIGKLMKKLEAREDISSAVDGIGNVISESLYAWADNKARQDDFADIMSFLKIRVQDAASGNALEGKTVVITGSLKAFKNRDEFVAFVESNGGKVSGSVSKKTHWLVNNDITSVSGKNKKAKELGIPIISEEEFRNIVLA